MTRPEPDEEGVVWTCHVPCETPQAARAKFTWLLIAFATTLALALLSLALDAWVPLEHVFTATRFALPESNAASIHAFFLKPLIAILFLPTMFIGLFAIQVKLDARRTSPTGWLELTCHLTPTHLTATRVNQNVLFEHSWDNIGHYQKVNACFYNKNGSSGTSVGAHCKLM